MSPSYIVGGVPSSLTCSVILEKKTTTTTTTIHCQFFSYQLRNHLVTKVTVKIWEHCYKEVQHGQTIRQVVNQLKVFDSDCLKRYLEVKFKGSKWVKVEPWSISMGKLFVGHWDDHRVILDVTLFKLKGLFILWGMHFTSNPVWFCHHQLSTVLLEKYQIMMCV